MMVRLAPAGGSTVTGGGGGSGAPGLMDPAARTDTVGGPVVPLCSRTSANGIIMGGGLLQRTAHGSTFRRRSPPTPGVVVAAKGGTRA